MKPTFLLIAIFFAFSLTTKAQQLFEATFTNISFTNEEIIKPPSHQESNSEVINHLNNQKSQDIEFIHPDLDGYKSNTNPKYSIHKLNWVQQFGGSEKEKAFIHYPRGMDLDKMGNIVVGGYQLERMEPKAYIKKYNAEGELQWKINYGKNSSIGDVKFNDRGEVFVTGTFASEIDFDPSTYSHKMKPLTSRNDIGPVINSFILKLNSAGQFLWVKRINVRGNFSIPNKLTLDANENIYISQMVFNKAGTNENVYLSCKNKKPNYLWKKSNEGEVYIVKMGVEGDLKWYSKLAIAKDHDAISVRDIAVDEKENILITGEQFIEDRVNSYIRKLNSEGKQLWNVDLKSQSKKEGTVASYNLKLTEDGSVLATGYFEGRIAIRSNDVSPLNLIAQGHTDAFVIKIDDNANLKWVNQIKGGFDFYNDMATVNTDFYGDVYVSGFFKNYSEFKGPNEMVRLTTGKNKRVDTFIAKLSSDGKFKSVTQLKSQTSNTKGKGLIMGGIMKIDKNLNVFLSGAFSGEVDFDPSENESVLKASSFQDTYLAKYSLISN